MREAGRARAPGGGLSWAVGSIEGPFVLISYFFRKKSTSFEGTSDRTRWPSALVGN